MLGGARAASPVDELCESIAFDAFPYQILGQGHLERLGAVPSGADVLPDGKVELRIGEPTEWLLDPWVLQRRGRGEPPPTPWQALGERRRNPEVQAEGRRLLAPCLVTQAEAEQLIRKRY